LPLSEIALGLRDHLDFFQVIASMVAGAIDGNLGTVFTTQKQGF
jgi:uncharacterized membrane protein YoaK (UPF0700 family)